MAALGERLSAARSNLGLSPAAAAAALRIRTSFVEAMEREDWGVLGAPVYVRGFLRNYAKLVGLDADALVEQLPDDQRVVVAPPEPTIGIGTTERAASSIRASRWYPWVLVTLTIVSVALVANVAIGMIGLVFFPTQHQNAVSVAQAPPAGEAVSNPSSTSNVLLASAAAQSRSGVDLRLSLTQPSWLSVTVDGKRVVYETLPAGTVREFHGARQISLRAGNAGGVVANFDGKDLGTLGTAGQVQDRVFAAKTPVAQMTGPHE